MFKDTVLLAKFNDILLNQTKTKNIKYSRKKLNKKNFYPEYKSKAFLYSRETNSKANEGRRLFFLH